jgi:Arc/MetJ-type ribon-helix-helix transcriptional regulator
MATRSISVSLEEAQLQQLDEELNRACGPDRRNRSSALSEALELWLKQRRLEALQQAYHQLGRLEGGDAAAAAAAATAMGSASLGRLND